MKAPSEEIYTNQCKEHNVAKYIQWATTLMRQYLSICIRLAVVTSQICEIPRSSHKIRTYSGSR